MAKPPKKPSSKLKSVSLETVWREFEQIQADQVIIKDALVDVSKGLDSLKGQLAQLIEQLESLKP